MFDLPLLAACPTPMTASQELLGERSGTGKAVSQFVGVLQGLDPFLYTGLPSQVDVRDFVLLKSCTTCPYVTEHY